MCGLEQVLQGQLEVTFLFQLLDKILTEHPFVQFQLNYDD